MSLVVITMKNWRCLKHREKMLNLFVNGCYYCEEHFKHCDTTIFFCIFSLYKLIAGACKYEKLKFKFAMNF